MLDENTQNWKLGPRIFAETEEHFLFDSEEMRPSVPEHGFGLHEEANIPAHAFAESNLLGPNGECENVSFFVSDQQNAEHPQGSNC